MTLHTTSQETCLWKCVHFHRSHCELHRDCSGMFYPPHSACLNLTTLQSLGHVSPLSGTTSVTKETLTSLFKFLYVSHRPVSESLETCFTSGTCVLCEVLSSCKTGVVPALPPFQTTRLAVGA